MRLARYAPLAVLPFLAGPALAQRRPAAPAAAVSAESLRVKLFALAHDSMGGRDTGSRGNVMAADWVAETFRRYGLEPAGENGSWFQVIPFWRLKPDTSLAITASGTRLVAGRDFVQGGPAGTFSADGLQAVYGGTLGDSTSYAGADAVAGKMVVVIPPPGVTDMRAIGQLLGPIRQRYRSATALAIAAFDGLATDIIDQQMQGRVATDSGPVPAVSGTATFTVSRAAARALLGGDPAGMRPGQAGATLAGRAGFVRTRLEFPARNVVGILRGSDPALRNTYLSLSAHNDHVGFTRAPVDHDSTRAFNTVVRPMGADSRMRPATPEEATRVSRLRDSLRAAHAPRMDSIFNGADDDGTGTVALMELARVLASGPRPRRSILFVNHAAEERGLLGSRWYTDHPTVPLDSIIAEIDEDMIGRGGAADVEGGGPQYLEEIGYKRLSTEFGDTLEAVNRRLPQPFVFNTTYDQPGHPLQYYCRADHYSYARFGIPAVAFSRGEHQDYHQVTDEAQYIDYPNMARVVTLVHQAALAIANMTHRPVVDGPRGDPRGPCRQ